MATQVRLEVSKTVNARVHYVAKTLGVKVSYVYEMIIVAFLADHDLDDVLQRLILHVDRSADPLPPDMTLPQPEDD